ncbi:MAG: peroxiredoxin-like family protein [Rhodanobacteraceae bacterium]
MRINSPAKAPDFEVTDARGRRMRLEDLRGQKVLLSFFRDVRCPFCNMRVFELTQEYESLRETGLQVVTFFRSSESEMQDFVQHRPRPFSLVADPDMRVYEPYGIEHSWRGLMRAMMLRFPRMMRGLRLGRTRIPAGDPSLMPADFLIDNRGFVRRSHYGRDLGDHLPMADIMAFAKSP